MDAVADANPVFGSLLAVTVTVPSFFPPAVNVTLPVGGLPKLLVPTVAVNATLAPTAAVAGLAVSVTDITPSVIRNDAGCASFGRKLESPLYFFLIDSATTEKVLIEFGVSVFPSEFSLYGFPGIRLRSSLR